MKNILSVLFIFFAFHASSAHTSSEGVLNPGMVNPGYEEHPDWFKVTFLDLFEDIQDAASNNKRLMVYYYQDGCPYCKILLEENFSQREIAEKTQKYFDDLSKGTPSPPPQLLIEAYFNEDESLERLRGSNNTLRENCPGQKRCRSGGLAGVIEPGPRFFE